MSKECTTFKKQQNLTQQRMNLQSQYCFFLVTPDKGTQIHFQIQYTPFIYHHCDLHGWEAALKSALFRCSSITRLLLKNKPPTQPPTTPKNNPPPQTTQQKTQANKQTKKKPKDKQATTKKTPQTTIFFQAINQIWQNRKVFFCSYQEGLM